MKKLLVVLAALAVVLVCSGVAIVKSQERHSQKEAAKTSQIKDLKTQLTNAQGTLKAHDTTNVAALSDAGQQIANLKQTNTTLCTQIKAARLSQPLCK